MYQTSTEFLLEITRGYISIIKCKDPTHCIIRSNKHFIIRREHPTAQRPNTLHNKIQPTFYVYYVHPAISRCRLVREPYRKTNLAADFRFRHAARDQNPCQPHVTAMLQSTSRGMDFLIPSTTACILRTASLASSMFTCAIATQLSPCCTLLAASKRSL